MFQNEDSNNRSDIRIHECDACEKSFSSIQALEQHIQIIHVVYEDNKCDESFSESKDLKKHTYGKGLFHRGHKFHKCKSCGKHFLGQTI